MSIHVEISELAQSHAHYYRDHGQFFIPNSETFKAVLTIDFPDESLTDENKHDLWEYYQDVVLIAQAYAINKKD